MIFFIEKNVDECFENVYCNECVIEFYETLMVFFFGNGILESLSAQWRFGIGVNDIV